MACVTPLAGVWIEICMEDKSVETAQKVTPLAGVWIEIRARWTVGIRTIVTPLAGVWIEMMKLKVEIKTWC